jgi:hypothetical protein
MVAELGGTGEVKVHEYAAGITTTRTPESIVTADKPKSFVSTMLVATTEIVAGKGTTGGAVYRPFEVTDPSAELLHVGVGFAVGEDVQTSHVTV